MEEECRAEDFALLTHVRVFHSEFPYRIYTCKMAEAAAAKCNRMV